MVTSRFCAAGLIFLHHIPESWPNLLKAPGGTYRLSAAGEREGNARRRRATEVTWWIRERERDIAGVSIPSSARMHVNEGCGRAGVWLLLMDGVRSHTLLTVPVPDPIRWNFPWMLFSENSSCSACCCWCSHQSWRSVAFALILLHQRTTLL